MNEIPTAVTPNAEPPRSSKPVSRARQDRARTPTWRSLVVVVAGAVALSVYLFVNAPPPLAASTAGAAPTVPIRAVFAILEAENDAARAVWTEEIVQHGTAVGLTFDEAWREEAIHAGPLPALFLRETANHLERSALRVSLFLGSEFPINAANQFTGQQLTQFAVLEQTGAPQFFYEPETQRHTAMFPDQAIAAACVSCHNEHADSPKTDWTLDATMGATTWMSPDEHVTTERALALVAALRDSVRATYAAYLEKVATFRARPTIGTRWPRDGFFLPSEDVFMRELARRTSPLTLHGLLDPTTVDALTEPPPPVIAGAPAARAATATPASLAAPPGAYPTLVIRSARRTKVTIDHEGSRLMVARIPAGGMTSLRSRPPLRVLISGPEADGVEVEYDGKPVALPAPVGARTDELELVLGTASPERS